MDVLYMLLLGLFAAQAAAECYWPDGHRTGDGMRPCPGGLQCCDIEAACMSNGMCFKANDTLLYRGGCQDKSWGEGYADVCNKGEIH